MIHSSCYFQKHLACCSLKIKIYWLNGNPSDLHTPHLCPLWGHWIYVALMKGGRRMKVFLILQILCKGVGYFLTNDFNTALFEVKHINIVSFTCYYILAHLQIPIWEELVFAIHNLKKCLYLFIYIFYIYLYPMFISYWGFPINHVWPKNFSLVPPVLGKNMWCCVLVCSVLNIHFLSLNLHHVVLQQVKKKRQKKLTGTKSHEVKKISSLS